MGVWHYFTGQTDYECWVWKCLVSKLNKVKTKSDCLKQNKPNCAISVYLCLKEAYYVLKIHKNLYPMERLYLKWFIKEKPALDVTKWSCDKWSCDKLPIYRNFHQRCITLKYLRNIYYILKYPMTSARNLKKQIL